MTSAAVVLGCLTIPGCPEQVSRARAYVAALAGPAAETAALLTSELVTNAVLHTRSGRDGGAVTVVVTEVPDGLLVEVIDDGSPVSGPEVSGDRGAAHGHGLFLVEQLAARWGYLQGSAGTTVWFQIGAGDGPARGG
jgi:anti-sigma regulatory factor (Ser/Thr protein kinase)